MMEFAYQEIMSGRAMLPHHYIELICSVIERVLYCDQDFEQKTEMRNYVKKTAHPLVLEDASGLCVAKVEIRGGAKDRGHFATFFCKAAHIASSDLRGHPQAHRISTGLSTSILRQIVPQIHLAIDGA